MNIEEEKKYRTAVKIVETLQKYKYKAYFIGGIVRNMILGYKTKDIDIATSAKPDEIKNIFKTAKNIGISFGITSVLENKFSYDVATFRNEKNYLDGRHPEYLEYIDDPIVDVKRRDFTINSIYYDPIENKILDYVNGIDDIKNRIIRTVGNPMDRFEEDYLRMLRAIRFSSELNFKINDNIIKSIKKISHKIMSLPSDRIREELNKMFTSSHPDIAMQLLYDTDLMNHIIPELSKTKGINQPKKYHPEGDVFQHIKLMLKNMIIPNVILTWSIILHDIGKPETIKLKNGIEKFYFHADVGAKIANKILKRLDFSKKNIEKITHIVKNHMKFAEITRMREGKVKKIMSLETFPIELELHRLDCMSSNGITENFIHLLDLTIKQKCNNKLPDPLINGHDLLDIGFIKGPIIGKILDIVRENQLDNILKTKEEAINFVKKLNLI